MSILDSLGYDLRFAFRSLSRRPGFALPAIATLGLGIGAVTAIFTVVHGVLLQPLPFPEPARLVRLYQAYPEHGEQRGTVSQLDAEDWAGLSRTLDGVGVYSTLADGLTLTGRDRPEKLATAYVSGGFFPTLDTPAALGRVLTTADAEGDDRAVVISDRLWRRRLGAGAAILGSRLTLDGEPTTVVGVMPPGFRFPEPEVDLWALLSRIPESSIPRYRFVRWLDAVGRLAPGVTAAEARSELATIAERLASEHPDSNEAATAVSVEPLQQEMVFAVRRALLLLLAAVGALLLVACVNVANLTLARGVARAGELTVRSALGASRRRVVRQLFVESLVIALAGGVLGTLLAVWAIEVMLALATDLLPRAAEVGVDAAVLGFTAAVAMATALAAGVLPAVRATRPVAMARLRSGRGSTERSGRLQDALVAVEVAMAVALVISCGLLGRSLGRMLSTESGFAADRLLSVSLIVPDHLYPDRPQYLAQSRRIGEALAALPGVESVASIKVAPLAGSAGAESTSFSIAGDPAAQELQALWFPISSGFFRTVGVPLMSGRDFGPGDGPQAPLVALVNQSLARRYFAAEDPVGRRLAVSGGEAEIVGVVGDARHRSITEEPEPTLYLHQEQVPRRVVTYLLRTAGRPSALAAAAREAVSAVDPDQTVTRVAPLRELISESVGLPRLVTVLVALFSGVALVLAALGVYGVLSFSVAQRRREIGVRLALGADGRAVVAEMLRRGMSAVIIGVFLGMALAGASGRMLGNLLYGVAAADPVSFAVAAAVLLAAAFIACLSPARRAATTDPASVLREG